ncbi:MAG: hypothetical protein AB8B99_06585 [Phormidesmis sp.]
MNRGHYAAYREWHGFLFCLKIKNVMGELMVLRAVRLRSLICNGWTMAGQWLGND